jgi:hypothetical protein
MQQLDERGRPSEKIDVRGGAADLAPRTLDELSVLSYRELLDLYSRNTAPSDLTVLDGDLRGRALAIRGTRHGLAFVAFAALGRSPKFPWEGKTLTARSANQGVGVNRIRLPGLGRQQLFRFSTTFDPSKVDGKPCVFIDYDNPDNPSFVRSVRDELREVSPGLYLGPVFLKHSRSATLLAWFGLQSPSAPRPASA